MEAMTSGLRGLYGFLFTTASIETGDDTDTQKTVTAYDVAPILREPYIHTGYRVPYKHPSYYYGSLFQLHNETVNIWSHLLASMLLFGKLLRSTEHVDYANDPKSWPVLTFALGAIMSSFLSAHAHWMHSRSEYHHLKYFQTDYLGVSMNFQGVGVFYLFFTGNEHFYVTYGTMWPPWIQAAACFTCFAAMCCTKAMRPPGCLMRMLVNIVQGSVLSIVVGVPLAHKASEVIRNDDWSTFYDDVFPQLLHYLLLAAAGFFYGCRVPEVFYPGGFDIFGHGHQIFHFLLTALQFYQFECILDLYRRQSAHITRLAAPSLYNTLVPHVCLFVAQMAFLYRMNSCTVAAAKREHDKFRQETESK